MALAGSLQKHQRRCADTLASREGRVCASPVAVAEHDEVARVVEEWHVVRGVGVTSDEVRDPDGRPDRCEVFRAGVVEVAYGEHGVLDERVAEGELPLAHDDAEAGPSTVGRIRVVSRAREAPVAGVAVVGVMRVDLDAVDDRVLAEESVPGASPAQVVGIVEAVGPDGGPRLGAV